MKIFLCFPLVDGQTGPAIKHAFENLGHDVLAVDARLETNEIYNLYYKYRGDIIFCAKAPEIAGQIRMIKREFNPIVCIWNMDTRTNINHWKFLFPLIELCDYNFIPDNGTIEKWRIIKKNTFWLPQGLQDEVYNKPENLTDADKLKYSCDVSFAGDIGKVHDLRLPYIEAIRQMGINFKLWGCKGRPKIYNEEHNKMVSLSKINLGCSCWLENGGYTSVRDYKILGAGGFLLELYRHGLDKIFPSNLLVYYKDPKDLTMKIKYWLSHEKKRAEIAEEGYNWVHKKATYTERIRHALKIMGFK